MNKKYETRAILGNYDKNAPEAIRQTSIVIMQQEGSEFFRAVIKKGPDLASLKGIDGVWADAKLNVGEGKQPTILLSQFNGKEAAEGEQYTDKGVLFFNNQNKEGDKQYDATVVSYKDENGVYTTLFVKTGAEFLVEKGFDIKVAPKAESEATPG